jgi:hypothetical protein
MTAGLQLWRPRTAGYWFQPQPRRIPEPAGEMRNEALANDMSRPEISTGQRLQEVMSMVHLQG